jgi:argininosuccinate lyase
MLKINHIAAAITLCLGSSAAWAQKPALRDEFYWLGQMNKATAVINSEEGLLDPAKAPRIAAGIVKVLQDGALPVVAGLPL